MSAGQTLATVVVVKTSHDVAAPASGIVRRILIPEQGTVGKGKAIGVLQDDAGQA